MENEFKLRVKRISEMPELTDINPESIITVLDNGINYKATVENLLKDVVAGTVPEDIVVETITRPTGLTRNFVFEGNSRTSHDRYGSVVGFENQFPSYPQQLMELHNFKDRGNYYNVATWGQANDVILNETRYNTLVKPYRPAANGGTAGIEEAYLFIMTGILDVLFYPTTADSWVTTYKAYCDRAKADGFKVVVLGEFYGTLGTYGEDGEAARLKYNKAMMDYAKDGGIYMYIDTDNLIGSKMDDIFHADLTFHLTAKGKKLIADAVNARFDVGTLNASNSIIPIVSLQDLYKKVDKVAGKGLSTNDYTTTEKNKLASLSVGDTIEIIQVNGTPQDIVDKTVNIELGSAAFESGSAFAPALGTNDNYVTDAEKIKLSNLSGTNTGDETTLSIQTKRPLKTINNTSIEGTGNITITGDGGGEVNVIEVIKVDDIPLEVTDKSVNIVLSGKEDAGTAANLIADLHLGSASQSNVEDFAPALGSNDNYVTDAEKTLIGTIENKQALLVSGTNIKTINSTTVLGSGNFALEPSANKQNSLAIDGTGTKFVTVDAVNAAIGDINTILISI